MNHAEHAIDYRTITGSTIEEDVRGYLATGESDWVEAMETMGRVERIVDDYTDEINKRLHELIGQQDDIDNIVIKTYGERDNNDFRMMLRDMIDNVNLGDIVNEHDVDTDPYVVNTTEAAHLCGVKPATIRTWIRQGLIRAVKKGTRWAVDTTSRAIVEPTVNDLDDAPQTIDTPDTRPAVKVGGPYDPLDGKPVRYYPRNIEAVVGLTITRFISGGISSAYLDGERVHATKATGLADMLRGIWLERRSDGTFRAIGSDLSRGCRLMSMTEALRRVQESIDTHGVTMPW